MSLLQEARQYKLLKKYAPILESGKPMTDSQKLITAMLLENTRKYYASKGLVLERGMSQADAVGGSPIGTRNGKDAITPGFLQGGYSYDGVREPMAGDNFYLPNVVMPMLRRIMPELMANELVAVQPLNGPVGYALAYRPTLGQKGDKDGSSNEIGFTPVNTGWTGSDGASSGPMAQGPSDAGETDEYWRAYAGSSSRFNGTGMSTADGEWLGLDNYGSANGTYSTVSFGLMRSAVEAKTRKLAAHWTPELAEDMQAMHGLDVEKELIDTLTYEVGAEIDRQIITEMVKAAITGNTVSRWNPKDADGLDQMGRLATLLTHITMEANQIAIRTRRGNANFVVTTPRVCAVLQQMSLNKFTTFKNSSTMPTVPDTGVGALAKVGLLNDDSMLLIRDSYASQTNGDYILMGYKGKAAGDSGIIYCPYIPLQLQKIMQPNTFTPSVGARTRYGIMNNPWDASRYYSFVKVEGLIGGEGYAFNETRRFIQPVSKIDPEMVPTLPH